MHIAAPPELVASLYADYRRWADVFPMISGVRLLRNEGRRLVLEVDHREGLVINELDLDVPHRIELWESKRRYDAHFSNRFEAAPAGTRFAVDAVVRLKGPARLLRPFIGRFVRRQMRRYQLTPIKQFAEAEQTRRAAGAWRQPGEQ